MSPADFKSRRERALKAQQDGKVPLRNEPQDGAMNPTNAMTAADAMDDVAVGAPGVTSQTVHAVHDDDGIPGTPVKVRRPARPARNFFERTYDKLEAFISKLSMRDNFWNSICSLIWLPLAFFSGI